MELRPLRYFVAVAEELHFGRAAARLRLSQPPLSQQIRRLEKELQASLFHRTKRHVELTNAGRAFLGTAKAIVTQAEQAAGIVQRASRGEIGQLVVGCALWADFISGPEIIRMFAQRLERLKRPAIAYRRLQPAGPAVETLIAWRRGSELPLVQAFVKIAREVARSKRRPVS